MLFLDSFSSRIDVGLPLIGCQSMNTSSAKWDDNFLDLHQHLTSVHCKSLDLNLYAFLDHYFEVGNTFIFFDRWLLGLAGKVNEN